MLNTNVFPVSFTKEAANDPLSGDVFVGVHTNVHRVFFSITFCLSLRLP